MRLCSYICIYYLYTHPEKFSVPIIYVGWSSFICTSVRYLSANDSPQEKTTTSSGDQSIKFQNANAYTSHTHQEDMIVHIPWTYVMVCTLPVRNHAHVCVGHHGSVVACTTYKREVASSIPSWADLCSDIVLLGKALCPHMHSLDPGVSGYLAGQWKLVCLNSSVHRKWQPGCMLPRELRWFINEQVLWPGGNCAKSRE